MRQLRMNLSASLAQIAGAPEGADLSLDDFLALVHPDDRSQVVTVMRPSASTAARVALCRFRRPSGDIRWTVLRADRGRSVGLVLDLTPSYEAYRQAREAITEGGALDETLARASVALVATDGTRVVAVNDPCGDLLGRPSADLAAEPVASDAWQAVQLAGLSAPQARARGGGARLLRLASPQAATTLVLAVYDELIIEGARVVLVALLDASVRFDQTSETDEAFRRLAAGAADGLALIEGDQIVDCTETLADSLGYTPDELTSRPLAELADPASADDLAAEVIDTPRLCHLRHRDGTARPFEVETRSAAGLGAGARVLAFRDLTERERADRTVEALAASREQFRELAESHSDGVVLLDGERVVHANRKFAAMLGREVDELVGASLADLTAPDSRRLATIPVDSEEPVVLALCRPDGAVVAVDVAPRAVKADGRTYRVATVRDVTERERTEQLRRAVFAGTAGVTGAAFFDVLVGRLAEAMQVKHALVAEFVGTPPTEVAAISLWHDGATRAPVRRRLAGTPCEIVLWHGAQYFPADVATLFPADRWLTELGATGYFGAPLFDSGGRTVGVLAVLDDAPMARTDEREDLLAVSAARASVELQRSHFEAEIQRLNADLEVRVADRTAELAAANRELEAFSYSVSHDLRAPARQIGAFTAQLLKHTPELSAGSREFLDDIGRAAAQMSTLIDALLEFSRSTRTELTSGIVDLSELVTSLVAELSRTADHPVDWRLGQVPAVRGDRLLLRQVFLNLLANAIKYSRTRERPRIEFGVAPGPAAAGEVICYVRDNGVGFDMKRAGKLFGVFQRLHAASEFEGTGIGLANVHQIVTRHGGRVWAEATPNVGATFYVALPTVAVPHVAAS